MATAKRSKSFVAKPDGVGGLIIPDDAVAYLETTGTKLTMTIDGVEYPAIRYGLKTYPVIKTPQGWTIGGEIATQQHAKNVTEKRATPRFHKFKAKHRGAHA
jgi:hypothetical protein